MWQIREGQVEALRIAACGRFVRMCLTHLRERYPAETAANTDVELRMRIAQGVARADGYGIRRERDVVRFVELMTTHGDDFDVRPDGEWARAILWDRTLPGPDKTQRIRAAAAARTTAEMTS
jgi:hypothetical protein